MNAYEIPNLRFSVPAGEAVARRRFVAIDSNGAGVLATADSVSIGASTVEAAVGEALDIADGIVIVEASAAIAAGAKVSVATGGKAVTANAGIVVGVAMTSAAADKQFITVKMN